MAQGVSGAPAALEVHVTGRRVLATIVDAIVLASERRRGPGLVYPGLRLLQRARGLPGADPGQDATRYKGGMGRYRRGTRPQCCRYKVRDAHR